LGTRNGAWSKTIKIPGTNHNNSILGNVFNINLTTFDFDPLKKVDVQQIVDGQVIFEGTFQLRKINKKWLSSTEFKVEYDCSVKNDASSLFADLSGKFLTDLDLSQYDHFFKEQTVIDSFNSGNYLDGYQYFLGFNGSDVDYWGRNFIPAVYARTYLDAIINEAGYSYDFPEMDELNFNNLIIPFNGEVYSPAIDRKFLFRAGTDTLSTYNLYQNFGNGLAPNQSYSNAGYPDTPIRYNDTQNPPLNFIDNSGVYNTTLYRYDVSAFTGSMDFTYNVRGQIGLTVSGGTPETTQIIGDVFLNPRARVKVYDANGVVLGIIGELDLTDDASTVSNLNVNGADLGPILFFSFVPVREINATGSATFSSGIFGGNAAYIQVEMQSVIFGQSNFLGAFGPSSLAPNGGGHFTTFQFRQDQSNSVVDNVLFNTASSEIAEDTQIYTSTLVPKEYKQSEFLLDLSKMFNLYIYQDTSDNKRVIIKTRDRFYADGDNLDWNEKIDLKSVDLEFLSNTQKKIKKLTYAPDDEDVTLKEYQEFTRETYGQLRYVFENEHIRDTDEMITTFSPTVTIYANGMYLPYIDSQEPNNNVRILQIGDVLKGQWNYVQYQPNPQGVFLPSKTPYQAYRHAGMLWPNPIDPELDISFGTPQYFAYPVSLMTNANLYNRFYRNQLQILERGKILRAEFRLTAADIATIKFDERIWLLESWWNINRIIDFDATKPGLTRVELVSADSALPEFIAGQFTIESGSASNFYGKAAQAPQGKNEFGPGTSNIGIWGKENVINAGSGNIVVVGDRNAVRGREQIVLGQDNQVSGQNVAVLGIEGGRFDESNRVYLATPIVVSNFIQAGRDEVLSPFPDAKTINYVSGSRDEVRNLGFHSMENQIQAGRNSI